MEVIALIIEQLDADGTLRSFQMAPSHNQKLIVAFADEYEETRSGPFHFVDPSFARDFDRGFAAAQTRRVGKKRFFSNNSLIHFETFYQGIPTKRQHLTYYALSLPEFAIPESIRVIDPHSDHEYRKNITRDDDHRRFIVYLECRSSRGLFDFVLSTDFRIDQDHFSDFNYHDAKTDAYGRQIDEYKYHLDNQQSKLVQQFFADRITIGDNYSADQAGAMGPHAQAGHMTFQQNRKK